MVRMSQKTESAFRILKEMESSELSLLRHDQRFRSLFENAMAGLVLANLEGEIIEANPSFCALLGYENPEELIGVSILEITHPEDREKTREDLMHSTNCQENQCSREKRYLRKDGSFRWGLRTASCLYDAAGRPVCRIAMVQDIHERKNLEAQLRRSEQFWKSILDSLVDSAFIIDAQSREILWANATFLREIRLGADQVLGRSCHDIGHFRSEAHTLFGKTCPLRKVIADRKPVQTESHVIDAEGKERYLEISYSPLNGEPGKIIYLSRDITQRRLAQREAEQLASFDTLTGLANRNVLLEQLRRETAAATRHGHMVAGFFLDIDRFTKVNDSLGHAAGDELLRAVASRLRQVIRRSDIIGRLGADEFAIIAPWAGQLRDTTILAGKLLEVFREPFVIDGLELFITASIGIALFPDDCATEDDLLQRAGTAMNEAKKQGCGSYRYFSAELNRDAVKRLRLENDLYRALDREELFLAYQPQIDLHAGRIVGVEALVRWRHPERGIIAPGEFIPLAEETGFILPMSEWILRTACARMSAWRRQGLPLQRVAVNLSGVQFRDPALLARVEDILAETGLPGDCLELELTETILMDTGPETVKIINGLKKLGIHLAIDDFGTGYSSLVYLKNFAMDRIKIAREFISDLENPANRAIVQTMISMARGLEMEVIAEGVENKDQLAYLQQQGCGEMQGFYFSRPLEGAEIEEFLSRKALAIPFGLTG